MPFRGPGFELTALANQHLAKAAEVIEQYDVPNRMQCHSFRLQTDSAALLYSSDLADFSELLPHLNNLDYAVVESTHIDLERLLQMARSSTVKQFLLTHLGVEGEVATLQERIESAGATNVGLAFDGLRLQL